MPLKASILTIGTEILDGQIIDTNSQWISKKLLNQNIPITLHATVGDEREEILRLLAFAEQQADLLFICGGLGPTSDDITRDILAEHFQLPLVLDADAWQAVQSKLQARQVQLREGHQRQCLFPQGAQALENDFGVAPGFYFTAKNKKIWALPGPPPEIESVWNLNVEEQLKKSVQQASEMQLHKWLCLGVAESELAHQTEEFFNQFSFKKKYGYRLQVPYVEIKLWHEPHHPEVSEAINKYTKALGKSYLGPSTEELYKKWLQFLKKNPGLHIYDQASDGSLLKKLIDISGDLKQYPVHYHLISTTEKFAKEPSANSLQIHTTLDTSWKVDLETKNKKESFELDFPSKRKSKYKNQFLIEKLIIKLSEGL